MSCFTVHLTVAFGCQINPRLIFQQLEKSMFRIYTRLYLLWSKAGIKIKDSHFLFTAITVRHLGIMTLLHHVTSCDKQHTCSRQHDLWSLFLTIKFGIFKTPKHTHTHIHLEIQSDQMYLPQKDMLFRSFEVL